MSEQKSIVMVVFGLLFRTRVRECVRNACECLGWRSRMGNEQLKGGALMRGVEGGHEGKEVFLVCRIERRRRRAGIDDPAT